MDTHLYYILIFVATTAACHATSASLYGYITVVVVVVELLLLTMSVNSLQISYKPEVKSIPYHLNSDFHLQLCSYWGKIVVIFHVICHINMALVCILYGLAPSV